MSGSDIPSSILIIGSGVFGLSTALSLSKDPKFKETEITLVDQSPFPTPDGASVRLHSASSRHRVETKS